VEFYSRMTRAVTIVYKCVQMCTAMMILSAFEIMHCVCVNNAHIVESTSRIDIILVRIFAFLGLCWGPLGVP